MERFIQKKAAKGNQKWIQTLINEKAEILNQQLRIASAEKLEKKCFLLKPNHTSQNS